MIDRIKKIMESRQINSAQFADEIGVQRSALSHVLSGRNNPSLDFMLKIKQRYPEINLDWLLIGNGNMLEKNVTEKQEFTNTDENDPEIEFQTNETITHEEKSTTDLTQTPAKTTEIKKSKVSASITKIPKQVILLFDDNTFQLFDGNPNE
jgi:transcriptional regulator with XRE-family HTH domain